MARHLLRYAPLTTLPARGLSISVDRLTILDCGFDATGHVFAGDKPRIRGAAGETETKASLWTGMLGIRIWQRGMTGIHAVGKTADDDAEFEVFLWFHT